MPFIGNQPTAVPLTSADITDSIITSAKITDATIVNGDIANATIALAKLSATGTPSAATFLRGDNTWNTPAAGSFVFLGETTASNVATVDLNGYFTSDYDIYKVFLDGVYGSLNDYSLTMRVATTGSYTVQTSDYAISNFYMLATGSNAGSTSYDANLSTSQMSINYSTSSTSTNPTNLELTIYNPMGSSWKAFTSLLQGASGDLTRFIIQMNAGAWRNTTAITGIRFYMSGGNIYARKIRIYGVKNT